MNYQPTRNQTSLFSASYTIYGKNFLYVLEVWNSVWDSILAWKSQIWYWCNSQMNCWASTRAQNLLLASYHIWSESSTHARILKITTVVKLDVMDWFLILAESCIILIYFYLRKKSPNTFFLLKKVITSWTYTVWSQIILIHYDLIDNYTYWFYLLIYEPECFK